MDMSKDEIVVRYRQAKHKAEQIKILADLNVCSVDDIIRVLVNEGGYNPKSMNKVRGDAKKLPIMAQPEPEPIPTEPIPEPIEDAEPTQPTPEPTAIDSALDVIRNQIREIDASISVLTQRKQDIIDKLNDIFEKDIFTNGTE